MTLAQFLAVIRQRWLSVAAVTFLAIATAAGVTALQTPQYRASSEVFVSVAGGDSAADLSQGNTFSSARVKSYTALAGTPRVLGLAARQLGLDPARSARLAAKVTAESEPDTVLIRIAASDPDPERAAAIANAVTDQLIASVNEVERSGEDGGGIVTLSVFQKAVEPAAPYAPRTSVNLAIGALGGLLLGIALALLRSVLDTRLRSVEQIRALHGVSVLAELPLVDDMAERPLIDSDNSYSTRAEAFRQLRTHLSFTNLDGGRSQSIVITSATPGEGKSSSAVNLAIVLAQNGSRVILVDADMRRPTVATVLGLESRVGLSTVLSRQVELDDAVQTVGGDAPLDVLAAGQVPPNPSELLGSDGMVALLEDLQRRYDHVIVDAPPLLPVTDPAVLGALCSGVLLVAAANGRLRRAELTEALSRLEQTGVRVLGVAINKVPMKRRDKTYYNYETAVPVSESPRRSSRSRRTPDAAAASEGQHA